MKPTNHIIKFALLNFAVLAKALVASFLLLAAPAAAGAEWHSFTNTDGSRRFDAELIGCDSRAGTVTVVMKDTRQTTTFKLSLLSEEDHDYAKARGKEMAAISGFRCRFEKQMTETGSTENGDTKITTYDGGYAITILNHAAEHVEDITVDYILVWRKDSFEGMGEDQIVQGSQTISTAIAGVNERLSATGIEMESRVKRGGSSTSGGGRGCSTCPASGGYTVSTRTLRSRDQLVGCLVQITVDGKVVKTEASGAGLLAKYKDRFESAK